MGLTDLISLLVLKDLQYKPLHKIKLNSPAVFVSPGSKKLSIIAKTETLSLSPTRHIRTDQGLALTLAGSFQSNPGPTNPLPLQRLLRSALFGCTTIVSVTHSVLGQK